MSETRKASHTKSQPARAAGSRRYAADSKEGSVIKGAAGVRGSKAEDMQVAQVQAKGGGLMSRSRDGRIRETYTIGREPFTKISAVEGIKPSRAAKTRAKQFDKLGLSSAERRKAIIEAHRPPKG